MLELKKLNNILEDLKQHCKDNMLSDTRDRCSSCCYYDEENDYCIIHEVGWKLAKNPINWNIDDINKTIRKEIKKEI